MVSRDGGAEAAQAGAWQPLPLLCERSEAQKPAASLRRTVTPRTRHTTHLERERRRAVAHASHARVCEVRGACRGERMRVFTEQSSAHAGCAGTHARSRAGLLHPLCASVPPQRQLPHDAPVAARSSKCAPPAGTANSSSKEWRSGRRRTAAGSCIGRYMGRSGYCSTCRRPSSSWWRKTSRSSMRGSSEGPAGTEDSIDVSWRGMEVGVSRHAGMRRCREAEVPPSKALARA